MTINQFANCGDSLGGGTLFSMSNSAKGTWPEVDAGLLGSIAGLGPRLGPGLRGTWLGNGGSTNVEWTFGGSWTTTLATDAWDKAPYGQDVNANKWGQVITDTATWTKPAWMPPVVAFAVDLVDMTGGGVPQMNIDGAGWNSIGQTLAQDNRWMRFHLATAVTSTIEFRCYNGSSNVKFCLVGVEPYFIDPLTATTGFIWQNLAISGSKLHMMFQSIAGDRMAVYGGGSDGPIKLGTGSPIRPTPNAGVLLGHLNDVSDNNTTQWSADHTTFHTRVSGLGPVAFWSPYEAQNASFNTTVQASYRTQTATDATNLGIQHLNVHTEYTNLGYANNAALTTAGLLNDGVHPSQAGHTDLSRRFYQFIRKTFFSTLGNAPTTYPVVGKRATVAYVGKQPSVAYAAAAPVTI